MPEPRTTTPDSERSAQFRALGLLGGQSKKIKAIERRIIDLVETAPPLSAEQRDRLVVLLDGAAGGAQ